MEIAVAHWREYATRHDISGWDFHRVDSTTSKQERQRIRELLERQDVHYRARSNIVFATEVFARAITLCINGLIDLGLSMTQDVNMFLRLMASSEAETIQKQGRAGRVFMTLYRRLEPRNVADPDASEYRMPKRAALACVLGMVRLKRVFPIIGVSSAKQQGYLR